MKIKATFFLPLADNDGRNLADEIQTVEDECFISFSGFTLMGFFKGMWRMETGARQVDTNAAYMVILDEKGLPELEAILRRFKARTTQEEIFLEVTQDIDIRLI